MKTKRIIAFLLCVLMLAAMLPAAAMADEDEIISWDEIIIADETAEEDTAEDDVHAEIPAEPEEEPAEDETAQEEIPAEDIPDEEIPDEEDAEESPAEPETEEEENEFDALAGKVGELSWSLTDSGTFTLKGTGAMPDFSESVKAPWNAKMSSITSLTVEEGVTNIGAYAFAGALNLASISLPESLTEAGENAFYGVGAGAKVYYAAGESKWNKIIIGSGNDVLKNAEVEFAVKELPAPVITSVFNYEGYIKVIWNAVEGAENYRLFMRAGTQPWESCLDTASTRVNISNVKAGVTYTFMVRIIDGSGSFISPYSAAAGIMRLETPKITSAKSVDAGIALQWASAAGASGYKVYFRVAGSAAWNCFTLTKSLSCTVTGLVKGTKYEFIVLSYASGLTSGFKENGTVCTYADSTDLPKPVIASVSNYTDYIKVIWNEVPGAVKYRLFYRENSEPWKTYCDTSETRVNINGLKAGAVYSFMVRCIDSKGSYVSPNSDATGIARLETPVIKAVNKPEGIYISWENCAGASAYKIYYKSGTGWKLLTQTVKTAGTIKNLKEGSTYEFCVLSYASGKTSGFPANGTVITRVAVKNAAQYNGAQGITGEMYFVED